MVGVLKDITWSLDQAHHWKPTKMAYKSSKLEPKVQETCPENPWMLIVEQRILERSC